MARGSGNNRVTRGSPAANGAGVRGLYSASMAPSASIPASVWPGRDGRYPHPGWCPVRDLVGPAGLVQATGAVLNGRHWQAVPLGQDAADPHGRGQLVLRHADQVPGQVRGLADTAAGMNVDAVMPERPGREHRDSDERRVLAQADHIRGQRQLGRLELAEPGHPEERLLHRQVQVGEVDSGRPDVALGQRQRPVIVPAGQGQRYAQAHLDPRPSIDRSRHGYW